MRKDIDNYVKTLKEGAFSNEIKLLNGNAETVGMFMKEKKHQRFVLRVNILRVITKF